MSIIQDLYNIYDKELSRYRAKKSSQSRLLIEMRQNLAFLREGLREGLPHAAIVAALENVEYRAAHKEGANLASLQKKGSVTRHLRAAFANSTVIWAGIVKD